MKSNISKLMGVGVSVFAVAVGASFALHFFQEGETSNPADTALDTNSNSEENSKINSEATQSAYPNSDPSQIIEKSVSTSSSKKRDISLPMRQAFDSKQLSESIAQIEEWTGKDDAAALARVLAFPPTQDRYFNGLVLNALGQFGRSSENAALVSDAQDKLYGFILLAVETLNEQTQAEALQAIQSLVQIGRSVDHLEFESLFPKQTMLLAKNTVSMTISLKDSRSKYLLAHLKLLVENSGFIPSILVDSQEKSDTLEEIMNMEILLK
jgi:hypothetical protein